MEIIRELAHIISKYRSRSISVVGGTGNSADDSKTQQFYDHLTANHFNTDEEAALFFYSSSPGASNYKSLKRHLKSKLINTLFFLNLNSPEFSKYEQDYFECCRNMAAARILLRLHATQSGIHLCLKVFKKAHQNEFSIFVAESARFIRSYYATRKGNLTKFNQYNDAYKQAEQAWVAENRAHEFYIQLMLPYTREKGTKKKTYEQAMTYHQQLQPLLRKFQSPFLHFLARYIEVIKYMSINDYEGTIKVCDQAIEFFEAKPYLYKTALSAFYHNKLACYTQLRRFEEGQKMEKKTLQLLQEGSYNWFRDRELFFMLAMHTRNYRDAYRIFTMARDHRKFRSLNETIREAWLIYESYLHFLVEIGYLQVPVHEKRFSRFRLGKFLNSVPVFSKDKRGLNIPILIIQVLFMIVRKEYEGAIDRIQAIEKYTLRHLLGGANIRSSIFIKVLMIIPSSGFHKAAVERKAGKYVEKLRAVPLDVANQTHEVEIIPYEHLWEILVDFLDLKIYRARNNND